MKQLQTIASFVQPHEAYVCAGVLRENGIDSFIKNELTTQTLSMISDQLGGVQLQVDLENVERATQILIDQGLIENLIQRLNLKISYWPTSLQKYHY